MLRFARESLGLSEEDVQQRTKISFEYLKALEANNYNRLPAIVYIRGFLKGYFQFLGVEDSKLLIDAYVNRMHNTLNLRESDRV